MQLKIHNSYRNIVALCDSNLIERKFEQGKLQLHVKENFYKDKEVTKEEAFQLLKSESSKDATFNIVGPESIQTALEAQIISKEDIAKIQDTPFALTLL